MRADAFMAELGLPEVYRVGGSVRDELIGRKPKDADYIVRRASLADLTLAGQRAGAKVSVLKLRDGRQVGVRYNKKGIGLVEVALPRIEVSTGPGHRDFQINTNPYITLEEDAIRRDFTFNALYRIVCLEDGPRLGGTDVFSNVLDPTGRGLYDLQHKLVRTTHVNSFRDDPLRMLRALRFVSTLGYDLTNDTYLHMLMLHEHVHGLTDKGVSGTALDELCKLLMGDRPAKALRLARDSGVLETLLPELKPMLNFDQESRYHDLTTDEHTFRALETAAHVDAPLRVRMALLFHDAGKPEAAWRGEDGRLHYYAKKFEYVAPTQTNKTTIVTEDHEIIGERLWREAAARLNVDRKLRNDVAILIREHMVPVGGEIRGSKIRRDRVRLGDDLLRDLYMHRMCDLSGKGRANKGHLQAIGAREALRRDAELAGVPATVKELPVDGHDMKKIGLEGADIGRVLRQLLDEVACQPRLNNRDWLLERAEALK